VKHTADFAVDNCSELKIKMLNWANQFSIFCLLDNHQYQPIAIGFEKPAFECLLGVGTKRNITSPAGNGFEKLQQFSNEKKGWLFGHFGYDLKNETEHLHSLHHDGIGFPDLHFFEPEIVLELSAGKLSIHSDEDPTGIFAALFSFSPVIHYTSTETIDIKNRIQKQDYINTVEKLKWHIARGDCYEINFCQEFFAENVLGIYHRARLR